MKRLWYYLVRAYVSLGLRFFYRKILVRHVSGIPRDEAVIFAANHQNAFLDAIVVACTNSRYCHFLVRADIFKKGWAIRLLGSLNMMPMYRIRDGWQSLGKNQEIFEQCEQILGRGQVIVIFPEGNQGDQRRLRNLSKGFTRIAFESIRKNPLRKIYVVPTGLNFTNAHAFRGGLSVWYGEPILANDYFTADDPACATRLKEAVAAQLKTLTTHIDDENNYASIISTLEASAPDYLDPRDTNNRIARIERGESLAVRPKPKSRSSFGYPLHIVSSILNFIPQRLWNVLLKKIKNPGFIGSMKFVFGIMAFPIYYLLVSWIAYFLFGPWIGCCVFVGLIFSMLAYAPGKSS